MWAAVEAAAAGGVNESPSMSPLLRGARCGLVSEREGVCGLVIFVGEGQSVFFHGMDGAGTVCPASSKPTGLILRNVVCDQAARISGSGATGAPVS